ncbi:MAG: PAS domain-containing protein, partial [Acidobacteriota bacterium]
MEEGKFILSEETLRAVFQALPTSLAVLDPDGRIVAVNAMWERFARENGLKDVQCVGVGVCYLDACRRAAADGEALAAEAVAGIEAVLGGELSAFGLEYPCHAPEIERWFLMRVVPFEAEDERGALVLHFDITERKHAELALQNAHAILEERVRERTADLWRANEELRGQEAELEAKALQLEEVNTTLNVLLDLRERDRRQVEEALVTNVKTRVIPCIEGLRAMASNDRQRERADELASLVEEVASPFVRNLSSSFPSLSPMEVRVASLIRDGRSTKEIAGLLHLSKSAIHFYRNSI